MYVQLNSHLQSYNPIFPYFILLVVFQFSSSPIKSGGTPVHRRCSSDPEFLASPELSPIMQGNLHSKTRYQYRSCAPGVDGKTWCCILD